MTTKKIAKKDIGNLLSQWSRESELLVPSRDADNVRFSRWDGKETAFLEWYRNTVIPPKSTLLPPVEEMFSFKKDKGKFQIEPTATPVKKQILFGVRPCDANAMSMLDKNFEDTYEDPYYLNRRKNTVMVGLTCTRPYDSCFCTSMGGAPSDASKVDIMLTDTGDEFIVEAVSDAGKELMGKTSGLEEATKADTAKAKELKESAEKKVTRKLDTTGIADKLRACAEDKDFWEKAAVKYVT